MAYKYSKGKNKISGSITLQDTLSGSIISASFFVGDGSLLTNIGAGLATGQGPTGSLQFKSGSVGAISGSANLIFDHTIPKFTVKSGFVVNRTSITGGITLTPAQHVIGVNTQTATASLTLYLPDAATLSNGQVYIIKDEGGMADINTITISCSVESQTLDNNSQILIESPYAAVNIYCNGLDKYFIY